MENCSSFFKRLISCYLFTLFFGFSYASNFGDPPVILNVPPDISVDCLDDVPSPVELQATDDDDPTFPKNILPIDVSDPTPITSCSGGIIYRIWTAQDAEGNITRDTQLITVAPDLAPPVVLINTVNDTVACEVAKDPLNPLNYNNWLSAQQLRIGTNFGVLITDECSGLDDWNYSPQSAFNATCSTRTVTFSITDNCGQVTTWIATYTVLDTIAPVLGEIPADITINCDDPLPNPPLITATDNCSNNLVPTLQEVSTKVENGTCEEFEYQIQRIWSVTDGCGNSAQKIQVITIVDSNPPDFSVPADITISCSDDEHDLGLTGNVSNVTDGCGGVVNISYVDQKIAGECVNDTIINRTWEALDQCGNLKTKIQKITKKDLEPPTFRVPRDTLIDCSLAENLNVTGRPSEVVDNCDTGDLTPTFSDVVTVDPLCEGKYTIRRTWEVADQCGNIRKQDQIISVEDLMAPNFTALPSDLVISCMDNVNLGEAFSSWIANFGAATATDNCPSEDGLVWSAFMSGTDQIPVLQNFICNSSDTVIHQKIDFVVADACGNERLSTAEFIVIDNTSPIIIACQQDTVISTNPGQCSASFMIQAPLFSEECSEMTVQENVSKTAAVTSSALPGQEGDTPVNPVFIELTLNTPPPVNAFSDGVLTIELTNADAESNEEYFNVYGEDGTLLGITQKTLSSCGNSTTNLPITKSQFDLWASNDGKIEISLEPFIPNGLAGRFAINDICPAGTSVKATLNIAVKELQGIQFSYKIDEGPLKTGSLTEAIPEIFNEGQHLIKYFLTDCASNTDSCSFNLMVSDEEPPNFACAEDLLVVLGPDSCEAFVELPFVQNVSDNCAGFNFYDIQIPVDTNQAYLTYGYDPNLNEYLAEEKIFRFGGVSGNAIHDVVISFDFKGDFNTTGAFVNFIDEKGQLIGKTNIGDATCTNAGQISFNMDAEVFNDMARDGLFEIRMVPNDIVVPPGKTGDGINPCQPELVGSNGDNDGLSYMFARVQYEEALPSYYVVGATNVGLTAFTKPSILPEISFKAGISEVFYLLEDNRGNVDTCSFEVNVEDREPPVAKCQPTTIFINPSGLDVQSRSAMELDAGSTDNCGIDTMFLNPATFTCDQINTTIMATLTVVDLQGNQSSCTTPIRIEPEAPKPTANSGLCGGDTLFLFANPPAAVGGVVFTYKWYNPDNLLISNEQNPVIPRIDADDAGPYRVEIQGITGCTAVGVVQVVIEELPLTPTINTDKNICVDENIVLTSSVVAQGNNAKYHWYRGTVSNGILVSTTQIPEFTVPAPHQVGNQTYYLVIEASGCISQPSPPVTITASEIPTAVVIREEFTICEGEAVQLGTNVTGPGITYRWTGPNGFFSEARFPAAIENSKIANAGVYSLVVLRNGCESDPDFTVVNILPKPATPMVTQNGPLCENGTLTLKTNNNNASVYHWVSPQLQEYLTTTNLYEVDNATQMESGDWSVFVTQFGCNSDLSLPVKVEINPLPATNATAEKTEVCVGSTLKLIASPNISGATYKWVGPLNYSSTVANPIIEGITDPQQGNYRLTITTSKGCSTTDEVFIDVLESVTITAVSNNGTSCISGPTDIKLAASVFPPDNGKYSYKWTGPLGFLSNDSLAVIPGATENNNGNYQLVVTNEKGCVSNTKATTVNVMDPPVTPIKPVLSSEAPAPLCLGGRIVLETSSYEGNSVIYLWKTPKGDISTSDPVLNLNELQIEDSGNYSVIVEVDGCKSKRSTEFVAKVNPIPEVEVSSNSPVCSGTPIQLGASLIQNASYFWVGPSDFTSSRSQPVINQADPARHSGTYTVRATVDGCTSPAKAINVQVLKTPDAPVIDNSGSVCISKAGELLRLSIDSASAVSGALYSWYDETGQIGAETSSLNFAIKDYSDYGSGTFTFKAKSRLGSCVSGFSEPTTVVFDEIPSNQAFAGENMEVCIDNIIRLNATPPSFGAGFWRQIGGDTTGTNIANPDVYNTPVNGLVAGKSYLFSWTLSNGACKNYSSDEVLLVVVNAEIPNAGIDQLACDTDTIRLNAGIPGSGTARWTQESAQSGLGVNINEPENPMTVVSGLEPGNLYTFRWTITSGCGQFSDDVLIRISDPGPFAGFDKTVCNDGATTILEADIPLSGSKGEWTSLTPGVAVDNSILPNTSVTNLREGENIFVWTIDEAICGEISMDTVIIDYFLNPKAEDDVIEVKFGTPVAFNPLDNDFIPKNVTLNIVSGPSSGQLETSGGDAFTFLPGTNFVGQETVVYEICSDGCECSQATIRFNVGKEADCKLPNIITPNGDGVNDSFVIPCLLNTSIYPSSQVTVFNQWGDEVYRSPIPYNNSWKGTYNGADLPVGTYFVIVDFGDGNPSEKSYLVIHR